MSVNYKIFEVAVTPMTGGECIVKSCQLIGLGAGFSSDIWQPFSEDGNKVKISVVRNPYDWLCSVYFYNGPFEKLGPMGRKVWKLVIDCQPPKTLSDFLQAYINQLPGIASHMLLQYNADIYLRCEDFPQNFVELAVSLGIDEKLLNNTWFHQCSIPLPFLRYGGEAEKWKPWIIQTESDFCERFNYYG